MRAGEEGNMATFMESYYREVQLWENIQEIYSWDGTARKYTCLEIGEKVDCFINFHFMVKLLVNKKLIRSLLNSLVNLPICLSWKINWGIGAIGWIYQIKPFLTK